MVLWHGYFPLSRIKKGPPFTWSIFSEESVVIRERIFSLETVWI